MRKEKVDFDLSELSLKELIDVYYKMSSFIQFLNENKIDIEEDSNE